jgi:hypothetical protein
MPMRSEFDNCAHCGDTIHRGVPNFGNPFPWRHIGNNKKRCENGLTFAEPKEKV